MAKNYTNSVIYCGTNTVFLRKALEEAGGFATESVTEDPEIPEQPTAEDNQ